MAAPDTGSPPARLPDEPARRGSPDGRAVGCEREAAARAAHQAQSAGQGVGLRLALIANEACAAVAQRRAAYAGRRVDVFARQPQIRCVCDRAPLRRLTYDWVVIGLPGIGGEGWRCGMQENPPGRPGG